MEERRKTERIRARLYAQWETRSRVLEATITNCSVGGCFVQGEVEEPGAEPVKLTIRLPNGTFVQLWGMVAFHLPTIGFGLHFTHPPDEDRLMFDKWRVYIETQKVVSGSASQVPLSNEVSTSAR